MARRGRGTPASPTTRSTASTTGGPPYPHDTCSSRTCGVRHRRHHTRGARREPSVACRRCGRPVPSSPRSRSPSSPAVVPTTTVTARRLRRTRRRRCRVRHRRHGPTAPRGHHGGPDHEHRRQRRRRDGHRDRRRRARGHEQPHVRAVAEPGRGARRRRRRVPQRPPARGADPRCSPTPTLPDGATICELGTSRAAGGRVPLRLLVPRGRRQAEPASVDRSRPRRRVRRPRRRRPRRRRPRRRGDATTPTWPPSGPRSTRSTTPCGPGPPPSPSTSGCSSRTTTPTPTGPPTTAGRSSARSSRRRSASRRRRRSPASSSRSTSSACAPCSAARCSRRRCSSRSPASRARRTSTTSATTTCRAQPGEPDHSWLGLMRFDYVTMIEALGGDARAVARARHHRRRRGHRHLPAVTSIERFRAGHGSGSRVESGVLCGGRGRRKHSGPLAGAGWSVGLHLIHAAASPITCGRVVSGQLGWPVRRSPDRSCRQSRTYVRITCN